MERDKNGTTAGSHATDPWAEQAPTWDHNPAVIAYADAAAASLASSVPLRADMRVLDFGCGTGLLAERVAPHVEDLVAVDASPAMVQVLAAKALPNVRFGAATWTAETIADDELAQGPFDLVLCSSVCAFLEDYPGAVAMLAARIAPGGHFVQWDWEQAPDASEPFGLTTQAITETLEGAGLEVVSAKPAFEVEVEGQVMRPLMGIGRKPTA